MLHGSSNIACGIQHIGSYARDVAQPALFDDCAYIVIKQVCMNLPKIVHGYR